MCYIARMDGWLARHPKEETVETITYEVVLGEVVVAKIYNVDEAVEFAQRMRAKYALECKLIRVVTEVTSRFPVEF